MSCTRNARHETLEMRHFYQKEISETLKQSGFEWNWYGAGQSISLSKFHDIKKTLHT